MLILSHNNTGYLKIKVGNSLYEYQIDPALVRHIVEMSKLSPMKALNHLKKKGIKYETKKTAIL